MDIRVKNLGKSYKKNGRKIPVIHDFCFIFEQGKITLVKGESGKGKTTLLTLLALLQKEDTGEIYFGDRLISCLNNEEKCKIRRKNIGIVFQDFNLINGLTVLENIILADVCEGSLSRKEAENKAVDVLKLLDLEHRRNHYPFELSGGEQQRVGVGRAIFKEPDVLICDEPVSNLDSENSKRIVDFLDEYCHKNNKLVIVTSHNEYFDTCADRVINI